MTNEEIRMTNEAGVSGFRFQVSRGEWWSAGVLGA
jgi:hypothetical protein